MKVVIGLGNPGSRYEGTRHNVGFDVIDDLARSPGCSGFQKKFQAQIAELFEDGEKILLVKPETFMNLSGRCAREILDFYQLTSEDLLVICDDMNLPLGKLRARSKGSHGGHNGLRDIQNHLGTSEYARLRIGVDSPRHEAVDHVLGRFRPTEHPIIEDAISLALQAVTVWIHQGIGACMNRFNGGPEKEKKKKKKKDEDEGSASEKQKPADSENDSNEEN